MATKAKPHTKKKKKPRSLSAGARTYHKTAHKKKKKYKKRAKGLSAMLSTPNIVAAVKEVVFGSGGGFLAGAGHQVMADMPTMGRIAIQTGISVVFGRFLGWSNVAAGYAGGSAALESQAITQKMLSEVGLNSNAKYVDNNAANQLPVMLNANGVPLTLMEDTDSGQFMYFDEASGATYLAEDVYPQYVPKY